VEFRSHLGKEYHWKKKISISVSRSCGKKSHGWLMVLEAFCSAYCSVLLLPSVSCVYQPIVCATDKGKVQNLIVTTIREGLMWLAVTSLFGRKSFLS